MNINNLEEVYNQISKRINQINFDALWPGFKQIKYALYNDNEVYFVDKYIPKTDEFIANTSIKYNGEYIAIWYLIEDSDIDILTSKIIHEMFHGYQHINNESRFPDETEAIVKYAYSSQYLQIKYEEDTLLASLINKYDLKDFNKFLEYRKYREFNYNYEYMYESKIETIEGSAQYVEMKALRELSSEKYLQFKNYLVKRVNDLNMLIPIRIVSYDIGSLLLLLCIENNFNLDLRIGEVNNFFLDNLLSKVTLNELTIKVSKKIDDFYKLDYKQLETKVNKIITSPKRVIKGAKILLAFNVYSARLFKEYLYSEYILMYKENSDAADNVVLYGNYLVKLNNGMIEEIYEE